MAKLTDRGFTTAEADEFMARANGSHTIRWTADVYRWVAGAENTLAQDLPIIGGTLTLDGSDPTRRRLTLEVGGAGDLIPDQPYDPLAPFGQVIKLWLQIDRADGSWFPRLKMGEYPIQTTTSEWPGLLQTIEAADYSWVVNAYLHEVPKAYKGKSVRQAVEDTVKEALPDTEFFIQSPGDAHTVKVEPSSVALTGTGRWDTAQAICAARGFECFFNHNGNLVIRHDITNADNETGTVPGEGPDIGTVTNPAAVISDGPGGNLVALTVGLTREGAINGVFLNLHETVTEALAIRKVEEADTGTVETDPDDELASGTPVSDDDPEVPPVPDRDPADPTVTVQVKALGTGSILWGDKYGRQNLVLDRNVKRINDSVIQNQRKRAKRLLHRRGGVIRSVDLDAVGLYWLEPDDKVRVQYDGRTEAHWVASVELDLAGAEPTRVRTRACAVTDPG